MSINTGVGSCIGCVLPSTADLKPAHKTQHKLKEIQQPKHKTFKIGMEPVSEERPLKNTTILNPWSICHVLKTPRPSPKPVCSLILGSQTGLGAFPEGAFRNSLQSDIQKAVPSRTLDGPRMEPKMVPISVPNRVFCWSGASKLQLLVLWVRWRGVRDLNGPQNPLKIDSIIITID